MKKLTLLIALLIGISANAQLDLGIRAGAGLAQAGISDFNSAVSAIEGIESGDREISFHAGAYLKIDLPIVFVQVEGIFNQMNQTASVNPGNNQPLENIELDLSRMDFPILVGTDLGPLRAMVGPVYSVNLSDLNDKVGSENLEAGTWGYQLGVGLQLSKLIIDLRYEGAFSPWASNLIVNQTDYSVDLRSSQLLLCLGFELF